VFLLRRRPGEVAAEAAAATKVWLAEHALMEMLTEAEERSPLETGGMLLGYAAPRAEPEELMVETVLGPGPGSRHFKHRFEPDGAWQERELAKIYQASGRITTYLGDWHTHPGGLPLPSRRDRKTARAIARKKSARMPRPLMLILGSDSKDGWSPAVFRWHKGRLEEVETELLAT
jgi:integrative and conjugative element protein (TIGR02256 family)